MKVKRMSLVEGMDTHIFDYPNFHKSGNVKGMKEKYYGKDALLVQCGNYIYNVPQEIYDKAQGRMKIK